MRRLMTGLKSFQIDYVAVLLGLSLVFCLGVVWYSFWQAVQ